ncbi:MAG: glycosyltransferase [Planctomycetales bacterium]|nr:glycosyltransferase [Planctomycetales bacterium]
MTALGSYGDVHPIIGLGTALRARGHEVFVISNPYFQTIIESAGLKLLPLGTEEEYEALARHKDLWDPFRGPQFVLRSSIEMGLRPIYRLLEANCLPGETVLVAHCLDMTSRIFQEKHGVPLASVHFAPVGLRSFHQSAKMFGMIMADWTPRWFRKAQYWMADRMFIDPILGGQINGLRGELGLPPVSGIMRQWYFSPQLVLGLFPEWFAPAQPDWPANTRLTSFPLWDDSATTELPAEVTRFLNSGDPPLVFAPGSAMTAGEEFFEAAVDACLRLGKRGVLLTKYPEQLPKSLPDGVVHFSFVPFSQLLPHSAALIHHGGIGTSAQGLAAGIPHLVMPIAFDQLDNATRLKRLGVADFIRRKKFRGPRLAKAIDRLLASESTQDNCRRWATELDADEALTESCELIEQIR